MPSHQPRRPFPDPPAQRMIHRHARWLERALRSKSAHPGIPIRKVRDGGFAGLMSTPAGRTLARWWWCRTLEETD